MTSLAREEAAFDPLSSEPAAAAGPNAENGTPEARDSKADEVVRKDEKKKRAPSRKHAVSSLFGDDNDRDSSSGLFDGAGNGTSDSGLFGDVGGNAGKEYGADSGVRSASTSNDLGLVEADLSRFDTKGGKGEKAPKSKKKKKKKKKKGAEGASSLVSVATTTSAFAGGDFDLDLPEKVKHDTLDDFLSRGEPSDSTASLFGVTGEGVGENDGGDSLFEDEESEERQSRRRKPHGKTASSRFVGKKLEGDDVDENISDLMVAKMLNRETDDGGGLIDSDGGVKLAAKLVKKTDESLLEVAKDDELDDLVGATGSASSVQHTSVSDVGEGIDLFSIDESGSGEVDDLFKMLGGASGSVDGEGGNERQNMASEMSSIESYIMSQQNGGASLFD